MTKFLLATLAFLAGILITIVSTFFEAAWIAVFGWPASHLVHLVYAAQPVFSFSQIYHATFNIFFPIQLIVITFGMVGAALLSDIE